MTRRPAERCKTSRGSSSQQACRQAKRWHARRCSSMPRCKSNQRCSPHLTCSAQVLIYATVQKQSALLASLDVFWLLCVLALAAAPLVLLIKNIRRGGAAAAGH